MSATETTDAPPAPRLKERYHDELVAELEAELGVENRMELPSLDKIVLNVGLGEAINDAKAVDGAMDDLATITGQQPKVTRARKSVAGFKLREGMPIGVKATLRGDRMWEFLDRLLSIALPRIRDFRGLKPSSFDGNGNYTFGVDEQLIFPEIDYDEVESVRGMDITICTTTTDDEHARALFDALGFPFAKTTEEV